jgi:TolB-like protein/DNA-binding winged helix-turn-helix (wHTH) protein
MYIGEAYIDPDTGLIKSRSGETVLEPKVMAVLVLLARHAGKVVSRQKLIDAVWGTFYGGDESLTRAISLLRKAFGGSHGVGSIIETIPKRGYRLIGNVNATAQPKISTDTEPSRGLPHKMISGGGFIQRLKPSGFWAFAFLAVLILIAGFALFRFTRNTLPAANNAITVMPFVALSSGPDDTFFASGLTEEVLVSLESLPELNLVAWSASPRYRDSEKRLTEIARILDVSHIIEGTVRRVSDNVRITVRLTSVKDGAQLWSQAYDRPIDNILNIQTDIAEKVAEALDVVLDAKKRAAMKAAGIRNVDAFIAFQKAETLQAKAHGELPQIPTLIKANRLYDEVTDMVPGYFPAYFIQADLYTHILLNAAAGESGAYVSDDYVATADREFRQTLKAAYETARNDLERAYVGSVKVLFSDNWAEAGDYLDRVFGLTSCGRHEEWTQILSIPFGRADKALTFFRNMTKCDPLSTIPWINAAMASLYAGDPGQALSLTDTAIEKVGFTPLLERTRFEALLGAGKLEEAQQSLQNLSGRAHTGSDRSACTRPVGSAKPQRLWSRSYMRKAVRWNLAILQAHSA